MLQRNSAPEDKVVYNFRNIDDVHTYISNKIMSRYMNNRYMLYALESLLLHYTFYCRPEIDDDVYVDLRDMYKHPSVNGVDWFIGHTQVQTLPQSERHYEGSISGDDVKFHLMDVNTANNSEYMDTRILRKICPKLNNYNKYGIEHIYYALIDKTTGEIKYSERVEYNFPMDEFMQLMNDMEPEDNDYYYDGDVEFIVEYLYELKEKNDSCEMTKAVLNAKIPKPELKPLSDIPSEPKRKPHDPDPLFPHQFIKE